MALFEVQEDERTVLQHKIEEILSRKIFTEEAKNKLLQSILFVYDNYNPPKYYRKTREEYVNEYLRVLENMNGYAVIKLEELNLDYYEPITIFRNDIEKVTDGRGNLEYENGTYIPSKNGSYVCLCKGLAFHHDNTMYTLDEGNIYKELMTIHHEMTHLGEGERPFLLGSQVPLSFELREMLVEGRAVTREANINTSNDYYQIERISDQNSSFKIESERAYPLYGKLYQTLELIFGGDVLEELALNNNREFDMLEELRKRFPEISVDVIFAHIIYIISCKENVDKKNIENAIDHMNWKLKALIEKYNNDLENSKYLEGSILQQQLEIEQGTALLNNQTLLQEEFQKKCETIKQEIEEWYKRGEISEVEYQQEMKEFEIEATLENYRSIKEQELNQSIENKKREEESLQQLKETLSELYEEIQRDSKNKFGIILEVICLKNPSLEASFSFLENTVLEKIQGEYAKLSDEEKESEKGSVLLAQIQKLFDLKEHTIIVDEKQKTSIVS